MHPSGGKSAAVGAILALIVSAIAIASEAYALSPRGSEPWLLVPLIAVFPIMLCVLVVPLAVLLIVPRRTRTFGQLVFVFCLAYALLGVLGIIGTGKLRMRAFARLADRSQPLVMAIHAFERDTGRPPISIQELVPRYLKAIPGTGMGAYPAYEYAVGRGTIAETAGNRWVLLVDTSTGPLNWDLFIYYPNQQYPTTGFGGVLRRIGKWAYVHE